MRQGMVEIFTIQQELLTFFLANLLRLDQFSPISAKPDKNRSSIHGNLELAKAGIFILPRGSFLKIICSGRCYDPAPAELVGQIEFIVLQWAAIIQPDKVRRLRYRLMVHPQHGESFSPGVRAGCGFLLTQRVTDAIIHRIPEVHIVAHEQGAWVTGSKRQQDCFAVSKHCFHALYRNGVASKKQPQYKQDIDFTHGPPPLWMILSARPAKPGQAAAKQARM
ncbi:hypothetical protein KL86DES1_22195 [uncultured Desulfovibrio sp.]|uniref:Uncharacterized protein n=1 Tax=uncultured Desulfovibrio sp. TaxID=167968 RepID=A0A212LBA7_9BACT|nr:hypothetical protein KL86DES1_22195 [uncultured Desulfovibrio sp.]VZH35088.1 conserved protein of unknown function [Desulfovibrio sp. 86]